MWGVVMERLTERERYTIELMRKEGYTVIKIAEYLNRNPNVIYYELKKGTVELLNSDLTTKNVYLADFAQNETNKRNHNKGRNLAIGNNIVLADRIEELIINNHLSPYCALELCKKEGLNVNICLSTLYNYIFNNVFYKLSPKHLIYGKRKKENNEVDKRVSYKNLRGLSIDERPKNINNRDTFGHWELDSVVGAQGTTSTLLVLTERLSRITLVHKTDGKTCNNTVDFLNLLEQTYQDKFPIYFRSITCDNGTEFLHFDDMEKSLYSDSKRTTIYYCHPYSSSERGSNENVNRIIRRFVYKGTDISSYDDNYIQYVQYYINNIPRKIHNGKSALEIANEFGFT